MKLMHPMLGTLAPLFLALAFLFTASAASAQTKHAVPGGSVTASSNDGNVPANTVDGSLSTRWSASGDGQWIKFDLGSNKSVAYVRVAFYNGGARTSTFDIQTSTDNSSWSTVRSGAVSALNTSLQTFDFTDVSSARYVRLVGHGNSVNAWNSYTEVEIWGGGTGGGQVSAPTFSPGAGTYSSAQTVTISTSTSGATIRYTADGSTPTATTGTVYSSPVSVPTSRTLRAIAYASGLTDSTVSSAAYTINTGGGGNNRPFPQALSFPGTIKPSNVTQAQMNDAIRSYYNYWKSAYVRQSNGTTPGGGYYVNMKGTGGSGTEITTSEAHGYGMLTFALMAGHDSQAKQYFDGMFNMYDKHRSKGDSDLMSWIIDQTESTSKDSGSATDGDMDIAYALLLADKQWGSGGTINYLSHARRIINSGLKGSSVSTSSYRTLLGDWNIGQPLQTRASDWMTGHMKAYKAATSDTFWDNTVSTAYGMISSLTTNYAPSTGLMPDFIINNPPKPAPPGFLEADTDDDYSWNSCRYPWRMALDAAHYNSSQARAASNKMINWLKTSTSNNPNNIRAGYRLNGTQLESYSDAAFTSPFIAASIVDPAHQAYLNSGWTRINNWRSSYYGDSINLLCMLLISGNWWAP